MGNETPQQTRGAITGGIILMIVGALLGMLGK
jgi:hypothetical protein